jgi:hypothetical protein
MLLFSSRIPFTDRGHVVQIYNYTVRTDLDPGVVMQIFTGWKENVFGDAGSTLHSAHRASNNYHIKIPASPSSPREAGLPTSPSNPHIIVIRMGICRNKTFILRPILNVFRRDRCLLLHQYTHRLQPSVDTLHSPG